jgi:hypothetical protein
MSFLSRIFKGNEEKGADAAVAASIEEDGSAGAPPVASSEATTAPDRPPPASEAKAPPATAPAKSAAPSAATASAARPAQTRPAAPASAPATAPGKGTTAREGDATRPRVFMPSSPRSAAPSPAAPRKGAVAATPESLAKQVADVAGAVKSPLHHDDTSKLWSEVEAGLAAALTPNGQTATRDGVSTPEDLAAARRVFDEVARTYMGQLRNLMLEVKWGEARSEWLELCEPALRSLRRMAEAMTMADLCQALDTFQKSLEELKKRPRRLIADADKTALLQAYAPLVSAMPDAFELEAERNRREPIIVECLLRQVPDVERVTIDKLYAAGLTSLAVIQQARADEIAATTAIAVEVATRIVALFATYRQQSGAGMAAPAPADEQKTLSTLLEKLRDEQRGFEEAAAAWSREALGRKKELRRGRTSTLLKMQVALARLGEIDLLATLEKLPFRRKIERIEGYLNQSRATRAVATAGKEA